MIIDSKLLALAGRLHDLTRQREQLDAEISQILQELVTHCRTIDQSSAAGNGNNNGVGTPVAAEIVAPKLPPADTMQFKVLLWLRNNDQPQASTSIATAVEHPHEATKSTLNAMRIKGLVRKAGRDLWAAAA